MKLTQKDKIMLALLCVVMVLAGVYMLVIKPMAAEKLELETSLGEEQASWDTDAGPVILSFKNEAAAQSYWSMSTTTLNNSLDNMINDPNYYVGISISNKNAEIEALTQSGKIFIERKKFDLATYINEEFLSDYIGDQNNMTYGEIVYSEYLSSESIEGSAAQTYTIATCKISVADFSCESDNDFYDMLNKMEKSGYILVDEVSYLNNSGTMSFTVLMTPIVEG